MSAALSILIVEDERIVAQDLQQSPVSYTHLTLPTSD